MLIRPWRDGDRALVIAAQEHLSPRSIDRRFLVGSGSWVLFSDPAHVKALFSASPDTARGGEANFAVFGSLTGSTSSLVTDGKQHARRRRLLIPAFAAERMRVTTAAIRACQLSGW